MDKPTENEIRLVAEAIKDEFDWTADGRICNSNDQKWATEAREDVVRLALSAFIALRSAPSTGKAEPPPTWEGEDGK